MLGSENLFDGYISASVAPFFIPDSLPSPPMASSPSHLSSGSDLEKREKPLSELTLDKPAESPYLDDALEKRVWRKLDLYVLPVVSVFYLLSFIVGESTSICTLS